MFDPQHERLAGPEEIARAVEILSHGGIVAFPTETVYGLGADAFNEAAIRRVFELKGRPATNPLIVHIASEAIARQCTAAWPHEAHILARMFWPGPLTLILPRSERIPPVATGGSPTVAVRCPDHHLTLALLETFGGPLVGPSANISGRVSPTTAEHVRESFSPDDVYVLNGGPCRGGIESTVLTLAEAPPRILRPGLISAEELEIVLGSPVEMMPPPLPGQGHEVGAPPAGPGMLGVHYAPRAPALLFDRDTWPEVLACVDGPIVALAISPISAPHGRTVIQMPSEPQAYAARLYAALREADSLTPALIAIEHPPAARNPGTPPSECSLWLAIMDRLLRATSA